MVGGLNTALTDATSGLMATQYAMAVASQNIANQGTSGYIREIANVQSAVAGNMGDGVRIGTTSLATNDQIQRVLYAQNADVASYQASSNALSAVTAMQGSTSADSGSSGTLPDLLGNVRANLIALSATPSNAAAQGSVISAAQGFVQSVNTLGAVYQAQRQTAQDTVVSTVADINTNLTTIGNLSSKIIMMKASGQSAADLENQRFTALSSLSSELGVSWSVSENGDMSITTSGSPQAVLPTRNPQSAGYPITSTWPLTMGSGTSTVSPSTAYGATDPADSLPGIMLNGADITSSLSGGTLGANITLRDDTFPKMQGQLDSFAATTASRFAAQGMALFTNASGQVPDISPEGVSAGSITGFAQNIQVSSTYSDTPAALIANASAQNNALSNVIQYTFSATGPGGVAQPSAPESGLGPNGTTTTDYSGNQGLIDLATSMTASQGAVVSAASSNLAISQTTQANLATSLSNSSGVSVNTEMSNVVSLQNAFTANAKVISTLQNMYAALMSAVGN